MFRLNPQHTFSNPDRQDIHDATKAKKTDYPQQVNGVNQILDKNGISISARSKASVLSNVETVEAGKRSEINAHQREALTFGRDAFESAKKGNLKQASVEALGSGLNAAGSVYKALYHETPMEKKGFSPW